MGFPSVPKPRKFDLWPAHVQTAWERANAALVAHHAACKTSADCETEACAQAGRKLDAATKNFTSLVRAWENSQNSEKQG